MRARSTRVEFAYLSSLREVKASVVGCPHRVQPVWNVINQWRPATYNIPLAREGWKMAEATAGIGTGKRTMCISAPTDVGQEKMCALRNPLCWCGRKQTMFWYRCHTSDVR